MKKNSLVHYFLRKNLVLQVDHASYDYSALSISWSPFSRSLGPKLITALARDHVRWYAVDRPHMRHDERRLRVRVMTLQTTDTASACAKKISGIRASCSCASPRPMDATDADPARLHGVLSCTFSVSRSLLLSRSLLGRSTYRKCTVLKVFELKEEWGNDQRSPVIKNDINFHGLSQETGFSLHALKGGGLPPVQKHPPPVTGRESWFFLVSVLT